jgi:PPP family 3-phenylpropionic acid transporter
MRDGPRVGLFLSAFFAAAAVTTAYLPLWFADRGLSAAEIGQVLGLGSLLRVVAVPGWGWLADAAGRRRAVLFAAAALAAGGAALLPAAGGLAYAFWPILLITAVQGVSASALTPLSDALSLALAGARRLDYGRTRAWGSAAYMLATAGAGGIVGRLGSGVVPWLLAAVLPEAAGGARRPGHILAPLRLPAFRLALLATALIQGAHATYYAFAPLYWRSVGIPDSTIGLLIAEGIIAEVALFIWGRALLDRLGPARLTALAAGASALRWTVTAFVTDVPVLVVVQVLHAGTFAFQHLSSMLVLRTLPAARAGTAQALLSALGFSAPTAALIWVSGQVYGTLGGLTFLVMAVVGGLGAVTVPGLRRVAGGRAGT